MTTCRAVLIPTVSLLVAIGSEFTNASNEVTRAQ